MSCLSIKNKLKALKPRSIIYYLLFGLVILLSVFFRLKFFLADRPLWFDEIVLAFNIVDSGWQDVFHPLMHNQAAAPLFMVVSKFFTYLVPDIEMSLRTFPLICSIASIFTFYLLALKIFRNRNLSLIALIIFSLNYTYLYYCQEFKQYSIDVLFNTLIFLSYFYINKKNSSIKSQIFIGCFYAVCPWFSFSSLFSIGAVFLAKLFENKKEFKKFLIFALPFIVSFVIFYINQHSLNSNDVLHDYWIVQQAFLNKDFSNIFSIFAGISGYYFSETIMNGLYFILFLIGMGYSVINFKNKRYRLLIINLALILTASYLTIYPFGQRISLHFFPSFILFTVIGINAIKKLLQKNKYLGNKNFLYICFLILTSFLIFNQTTKTLIKVVYKQYTTEDEETLLRMSKKLMTDDDILYIVDEPMYKFYAKKLNYEFKNVIIEQNRIIEKLEYYKELDKLPQGKTYYYVISHYPNINQRVNDVWNWAKTQNSSSIYVINQSYSTLIIFNKK